MHTLSKSYACILWIFVYYKFLNFFWNIFNFKTTIKVRYIFRIHIQSYLMSSYCFKIIVILLRLSQALFKESYFLNKHHKILIHFDNTFVFQNLLRDESVLRILTCSNSAFTSSNCTSSLTRCYRFCSC